MKTKGKHAREKGLRVKSSVKAGWSWLSWTSPSAPTAGGLNSTTTRRWSGMTDRGKTSPSPQHRGTAPGTR